MLVEVWQLGLINVVFLPITLGVAIAYTKIYTKYVIRSAGTHLESSSVIEEVETILLFKTVQSGLQLFPAAHAQTSCATFIFASWRFLCIFFLKP